MSPHVPVKRFALACVWSLLAACAAPRPTDEAAAALLEADRAFADDAAAHGVHAAFTAALAPDAVIFRPGPVSASEWLEGHPDWAPLIAWVPDRVEISSTGDLGVTSGTWTLRPAPDAEVSDQGRYITVWRLRDGRWQAVLDHGVSLPAGTAEPRWTVVRVPDDDLPASLQATTAQITTCDLMFARQLAGGGSSLEPEMTWDVEFLRQGTLLAGRDYAEMAYAPLIGSSSRCAGAVTSHDGTLSATWGTVDAGGQAFAYMRVWRTSEADASAQVSLDVLVPTG
jgi:hypothetical protein